MKSITDGYDTEVWRKLGAEGLYDLHKITCIFESGYGLYCLNEKQNP